MYASHRLWIWSYRSQHLDVRYLIINSMRKTDWHLYRCHHLLLWISQIRHPKERCTSDRGEESKPITLSLDCCSIDDFSSGITQIHAYIIQSLHLSRYHFFGRWSNWGHPTDGSTGVCGQLWLSMVVLPSLHLSFACYNATQFRNTGMTPYQASA